MVKDLSKSEISMGSNAIREDYLAVVQFMNILHDGTSSIL